MPALTIYLLREEFQNAGSAIEGTPLELQIHDGAKLVGTLFVRQVPEKAPAWSRLFAGYADLKKLGSVKSTSAVFITEAGGRLFALAFGSGRFLLKPGAYEDRFGLLVVINSVHSNHLRSIDKRTFDAVDQNVRAQVSQQSSAAEFGIDIEKDLIRGITGGPIDETFGTRMTGVDSLAVSVNTSLKNLQGLLAKYLLAYKSTAYKTDFPWIDHISQVGDKAPLRHQLDGRLIKILEDSRNTGGHAKNCWIAIPDIIDYAGVHRFRFSGKNGSFNDLHLPGFIENLKPADVITVELLKSKYAFAVNDDNLVVSEKWPVYKCLHCEIDDGGSSYLLAGGHWFQIKKDFADEVNSFFKAIPRTDLDWKAYEHDSEGAYNADVCKSDPTFALMDALPIPVGGVYDKVEFCDVFISDSTVVHVKRYGGSGLLGHLFNQGLVSAEHLREDKEFVVKVNAALPAGFALADSPVPRNVSGFKIVFAIISEDQTADLHIPFFARVALRHVYKRLLSMGYTQVFLAKIFVDEKFSKTQRITKKSKAKKAAPP